MLTSCDFYGYLGRQLSNVNILMRRIDARQLVARQYATFYKSILSIKIISASKKRPLIYLINLYFGEKHEKK